MLLSLVIPAHNEEGHLRGTVEQLAAALRREGISFEILVADDHSTDGTQRVLSEMEREIPELRSTRNERTAGFGNAVIAGLERFRGDAVCIVMADASDDPADVVTYARKLEEGFECVFGSRFMRGGKVEGYPLHKLIVNRLANWFVRIVFRLDFTDITNAFKAYRREVIEGVGPLLSKHFNLTVELPLKAIVRGYSYAVVPVRWRSRAKGASKLKIKEMGSRYLFIVLYVLLEKLLSRGDYRRDASGLARGRPRTRQARP
jgi:dolichol-phosphate mannosyltransferase